MVLCDQADLALERGLFDIARNQFEVAETLWKPTFPTHFREVATAGLGHAALESGAIAEALRREAALSLRPPYWYFDPLRVLVFRARLLERRHRPAEALDLLMSEAPALSTQYPITFIRVVILASRIARRMGASSDPHAYDQAVSLADTLRLPTLVAELQAGPSW